MSSDVIWHIRDKLWPMPKHGSIKATYVRCMRVLAVTCHLHFWQNDRDFLRATVVTRGWSGYRNKSQHRKSTLEKKILPPFQQGFEPATFQSRVRCSNHWAIPAPWDLVPKPRLLSPFLTGRMFVRPNILRTLRRTMIRFLIEHLVRRIWFGQSRLYFILNWLVMRCKLRPELAADAQQTAWSKM